MNKLLAILTAILAINIAAGGQIKYEIPFPKPIECLNDTVSVFIIGDVMMHSRQLEYDHRPFLSSISHRMKEADFCVANMEFPLGGRPYTGYPVFSTPDWYADYVAACGADVFLMANNHILDKGPDGLERTLGYYSHLRDSLGICYTGAAADPVSSRETYPLIISRRGIRIALINFTYGTNGGSAESWPKVNRMREEEIHRAFRSARDQEADFIIALPHWGNEYELNHSKSQERWAEWLVGEGADAIVGSHPHVVQDTSHIGGRPVIYSMGNAVSNMSAKNTRLELAVTLRFVRVFETGELQMLEPELDFMWCTLPGMLTTSYSTIFIKEWATRRSEWLNPSDYDNMVATLERVRKATGIVD